MYFSAQNIQRGQNVRITQGNFRAHLALKCDLVTLTSASICVHVVLTSLSNTPKVVNAF